jgi:TolB-like protein/tetratricopeptide (TPR) repeat protein
LFEGFLAELKRRHVIRVAGVYTVAAWGVFQVVHTILETLGFPKWTSTLTLALLVLGLPVVLVVSWVFERTPKGDVAVTDDLPDGAAKPKLSRMDMLLLAAMVVVVGLAGAQIGGLLGGKATILGTGAPEKSVAVLPFVVFSSQKDSDYFADGLTEEVINSLAQVPDLKVTGRTSAFYFKGKNEDLREVGKRLGVAHVVEGSVRQDGDRLRVTAQLISVKDGFHLWSKTYDRSAGDAFAIQSEIGAAVAEALKTKLDMKGKPARPNRDPQAYALEITSRAQLRRLGLDELTAARAGFEKLMVMEPDNAEAYAGYAQAVITLAQHQMNVDFGEATRISQAAIDKAIKLNPNSSQVWLAKATLSRTLGVRIGGAQYDRDLEDSLKRALALDPHNSSALTLLAQRLVVTGKAAEAEAAARKAVAVDPLSRTALMALGKALMRTGKLEEAEKQFRAVVALYPDFGEGKHQLAQLLIERGRLDLAEPWLKAVVEAGGEPFIVFQAAWVYNNLGLPDDAHKAVATITESPGKELAIAGDMADRGDWAGMLAYGKALEAKSKEPFWPIVVFQGAMMTGRDDEALAAVARLRPDLFTPQASISADDMDMPLGVAHVLRRKGQTAQADRLLDGIMKITEPVPGQRQPNAWRMLRARIYGERGQTEKAIAEVEAAYAGGWRTGLLFEDAVWLDKEPTMVSVRDNPRFKAVMAKVRQDLAKQRAAVLATRAR